MNDPVRPAPIPRRLTLQDPETGRRSTIAQEQIAQIKDPVVILGDPGLGKSVLTSTLGAFSGHVYVRAGSFVRHAQPEQLVAHGQRLVIDGLDEVASSRLGAGVDAVLQQLSRIGNPPFILSSREADWRGATDRIKIEDDYGSKAVLVHLQPFDRDDAEQFLARNFPALDAQALLGHLAQRGLEEIYTNPLTLKLMGEVAAGDEPLPSSRAQLLERACRVMLAEENPRHQNAAHAQRTEAELLHSAGAFAASLLLCDRSGVFTGAAGNTPDGYVHVGVIQGFPLAQAADDVLKTRLFQAEGENRFQIVHRVVAEYLGAKWLAACFEMGVSARRIFSLFGAGEGVPTSLRGLQAWLAHFSDVLAKTCIAADSYAVLRYGDADTLPLAQARWLLEALKTLSEEDPYFRSEDWGRHPASGLMKPELKDEILAIIDEPGKHTHLALLLLDAIEGTALARVIAGALEAITFDTKRYFGERSRAADALRVAGLAGNPEIWLRRLAAFSDTDSRRLASELVQGFGFAAVPMRFAVEIILAQIGLADRPEDDDEDRLDLAHISEKAIEDLTQAQLGEFLDLFAEIAAPLMRGAPHEAKDQVADIVRHGVILALRGDPGVSPERFWRWIGWLRDNEGYGVEKRQILIPLFREHPTLRRAIQAMQLLDRQPGEIRMAAFGLDRPGLGLYPNEDDVIALLEEVVRRRGDATIDFGKLEEIVLLVRRKEGLSDTVYAAASEFGAGNAAFLAKLDDWKNPIAYAYESEQEERAAAQKAERAAVHQQIRDGLWSDVSEVAAGKPGVLHQTALAYLGRFREFSGEATPEARVVEFLGEALAPHALDGFLATLRRDDLPTALQLSESHAEDKYWYAEAPMICGIVERQRRGLGLDDLPQVTVDAAFMAWRRARESNVVVLISAES